MLASIKLSLGACMRCAIIAAIIPATLSAQPQNSRLSGPDRTPFSGAQTASNWTGAVFRVLRTTDAKAAGNQPVEIHDSRGMAVARAYSRADGSFQLFELPLGRYYIVAGKGVDEAGQWVEVFDSNTDVVLVLPRTTAHGNANEDTVSAAQLRVPIKARKLLNKARKLVQKRKIQQAYEPLDRALEAYPQFAEALSLRGLLELEENRLEQARSDLERAVEVDPDLVPAHVELAATYNLMSEPTLAISSVEQGLRLSPNSWQGHLEFGKALLATAAFGAALIHLRRAAELAPVSWPQIDLFAAEAKLGLADYSGAVADINEFLRKAPESPHAGCAHELLDRAHNLQAHQRD